jgi:cytoskeletal protein RodZ
MQFFVWSVAVGLVLVFSLRYFDANAPRNDLPKPSSIYSTQNLATPAPEMAASASDMTAPTPEMVASAPDMTAPTPEMPASVVEMTAPTPDTTASAPEVAAATSATMASAPDMTAPTPDATSDPVLAAQPMTRLVPEVGANARAEAAPKKKRVASKHPRDYYPRNSVWWLWGF